MDWIILITAGMFETAFAFCMGKMKGSKGMAFRLWAAYSGGYPFSISGDIRSVPS